MKTRFSFLLFCAFTTAFMLISCEKEEVHPKSSDVGVQADITERGGGNGKGLGKGKKDDKDDDGGDDSGGVQYAETYQLHQADDFDPLYRFSISTTGDLMLLETDPSVTSWGTDYWGSWSEPFDYVDGEVNYINGLTNVTYQFEPLPGNKFDVTKILIVQPYSSNQPPTTTVSHPGVYSLVNN